MVTEFKGEYWFLSNFFLIPIQYQELWYPSVEHGYMSAKCFDPNWKSYCANPNISCADVKRESKHVQLIPNWHQLKFGVMEECLRSKFSDKTMREKLLNTGEQNLQEGNWWGDRVWGVDLKENPNVGENHLGRLLMKIRDDIRAEIEMKVI